ncbi:MAG TPA: exosortase-associated EpsI family protein, partial [Bryobacteraceae bacterium]|nr:exosortase-associated EpsI family protein [Bryobacteraceae bacterium]
MTNFWRTKSARVLSIVLLLQAAAFYGFSRSEKTPPHKPLAQFALENSPWTMSQELQVDKESLDVLKADDLLSRSYVDQKTGQTATLFV